MMRASPIIIHINAIGVLRFLHNHRDHLQPIIGEGFGIKHDKLHIESNPKPVRSLNMADTIIVYIMNKQTINTSNDCERQTEYTQ